MAERLHPMIIIDRCIAEIVLSDPQYVRPLLDYLQQSNLIQSYDKTNNGTLVVHYKDSPDFGSIVGNFLHGKDSGYRFKLKKMRIITSGTEDMPMWVEF